MNKCLAVLVGVALVVGMGAAPAMASHEIVIGFLGDRAGAPQVGGVNLCPGSHDYVRLVNSKGGVEGHKIKLIEVDHEYKVPPAVEAYERFKKEGAVTVVLYGTPIVYGLTQKVTEDKIPGITPGFGRSDATDGTRFPYIFPLMATYWSQATAAVKFSKDQLGGSPKGKKIAYLFFDKPTPHQPI